MCTQLQAYPRWGINFFLIETDQQRLLFVVKIRPASLIFSFLISFILISELDEYANKSKDKQMKISFS